MARRGYATAIVATIALAACGGSESSDDAETPVNGALPAQAGAGPDPVVGGDDRDHVQEAIEDVQDGLESGNGWDVCGEISDGLTLTLARSARGSRSCERAVVAMIRRARAAGVARQRSQVLSLDVRGKAALATVRDDDGPTYRVRVVKDGDGAWVLPRLDLRRPSGLQPE